MKKIIQFLRTLDAVDLTSGGISYDGSDALISVPQRCADFEDLLLEIRHTDSHLKASTPKSNEDLLIDLREADYLEGKADFVRDTDPGLADSYMERVDQLRSVHNVKKVSLFELLKDTMYFAGVDLDEWISDTRWKTIVDALERKIEATAGKWDLLPY